ncbi:MAG: 5-(carboxyamino)imidazole ribonucleotide mutase [Candidatus Diapherotrites archaeon]|nr:5-(carboxyamino)imidazole ribonucleotide mutase [Candidatus Diapherotrites archaeon]
MVDVLVLFGSKSDKKFAEEILDYFKSKNVSFELAFLSAHRTPKELEQKIHSSDAKVIIAGAGLSCALPGAVAAQTIKPVMGLPLSGNYSGLDALLACIQIPGGIPVLGSGIDQTKVCAQYAELFSKNKFEKIVLIKRGKNLAKYLEKAQLVLKEFSVPFAVLEKPAYSEKNVVYLDFVDLMKTKQVDSKGFSVIFVACKENSIASDVLEFYSLTSKSNGLFVGLNRAENAVLAALELLAISNFVWVEKLNKFREQKRKDLLQ